MFTGDVYKLLEGTADAAFVVTLEGEICFWSRAAERLFGFRAADVLNQPCYSVLRGEDVLGRVVCTGGCSIQHCAAHGHAIPAFDLEVTTRSGQRIWVNISTLIFEDSRLHRRLIAHLAHDISERKQVELAFARMVALSEEVIL
ncbi:MAG TPA: PAS domain S-box protein [Bryobacteraceae bacterium]|nr:PAS domain S-box protein [Bryobacteraceae bacterium]